LGLQLEGLKKVSLTGLVLAHVFKVKLLFS